MTNTQSTPQFFGTAIPAMPIVSKAPARRRIDVAQPSRREPDGVTPEDTALRVTAISCFVLTGGALVVLLYSIVVVLGRLAAAIKLPGTSF